MTLASRRDHASISPAGWASSKMAFAYRLAAPVATGNLLDGTLDQLLVLGSVKRFPDHLFGRRDHQAGNLVACRLDRTLALGVDIACGALDDALVFGVGLLPELVPELLAGAVRPFDDGLGRAPRFDQLLIRLFQACLGLRPSLFRLLELGGDVTLPRFRDVDDPGKHRLGDAEERQRNPGEEQEHEQEADGLDYERAVQGQNPGLEIERAVRHLAPSEKTNRAPNARLMKYIPSTSPMMMNMMPCS